MCRVCDYHIKIECALLICALLYILRATRLKSIVDRTCTFCIIDTATPLFYNTAKMSGIDLMH